MTPDFEAKAAPKGDGAPHEIEITPEMLDAGLGRLVPLHSDYDSFGVSG
jgi:hypothetical protein